MESANTTRAWSPRAGPACIRRSPASLLFLVMTIRHPFQQGFRKACQSLPLILCLVTLPACNEQQAATPPPSPPPAPVRVAPVLQQEVRQTVTLVGTVEPWKRSVVASEVEGLVKAFPAEEGMAVKRGQLLARLRTKTLRIQLDSALALYREAGARYQRAKRDLSRIRVLFKQELVTQKDFDDARAEETALKEHLTQLHAEIRRVKDSLNQSQIVAPFDGWITQEFTEVGQWVEEGGAIIEMVDLSHVKVEIPLPERYVSNYSNPGPRHRNLRRPPGIRGAGPRLLSCCPSRSHRENLSGQSGDSESCIGHQERHGVPRHVPYRPAPPGDRGPEGRPGPPGRQAICVPGERGDRRPNSGDRRPARRRPR